MNEIETYMNKLDILREYLHKKIDSKMAYTIGERTSVHVGNRVKGIYLDIRDFDTYYRHKTSPRPLLLKIKTPIACH